MQSSIPKVVTNKSCHLNSQKIAHLDRANQCYWLFLVDVRSDTSLILATSSICVMYWVALFCGYTLLCSLSFKLRKIHLGQSQR